MLITAPAHRAGMQHQYPDALEEIDPALPNLLMDELPLTVFVYSDHAHDVSVQVLCDGRNIPNYVC